MEPLSDNDRVKVSEPGTQHKGYYPYQASIDAYGNGGFRFADMSHKGSLLCLPGGMQAWEVKSPSDLNESAFKAVIDQAENLDVLLLGMGKTANWLTPELRERLRACQLIIEETDTGGAIRTYNILLAERRAVGAALIAVE